MPNVVIVIEVAGQSPGVPGESRLFAYSVLSPTPPLVTVSLNDTTGVTEYFWEFLDKPKNSVAVFSDPTAAEPTFTPDAGLTSTYLMQCTVNDGESRGQIALAFATENLSARKLAAGEGPQYDALKGWVEAYNDFVDKVDALPGGGNVTGPNPSTLNAIATYGNTIGTLLLNTKVRITSPGSTHLVEIDDPVTPGTWYEALQVYQVPSNGLPAGYYLQLGGTDIGTVIESSIDPYVRTISGLGRLFFEKMASNWVLEAHGEITQGVGDTTKVLNLGNTGSNAGTISIYVGSRDPNGNVTGNPGDLYIRDNLANSAIYQMQAGIPSTVWTEFGGSISADQVSINVIGSPTYNQVQETVDQFGMSGASSTNYITDSGSQQIDVALGTGFIRSAATRNSPLYGISWSALNNQSIPADSIRYVGVVYNAGSPQVEIHTTDDFHGYDSFRLGSVVNQNSTLHILNNPQTASDFGRSTFHRLFETLPIQRAHRLGGIIPADAGTRNYIVSAGELYDGFNEFIVAAIDTSGSDTFDAYYRDGASGWTLQASQTQWNNTQYDNNSGTLQTLATNRYGIHWLYIETDGALVTLYGQDTYVNLSAAESASPPTTVPLRIQAHGRLLGRLIFQESSSSAISVDNVWEDVFSVTAGSGDVVGPSSATASAICRYDGTTGKLIQDSDMRIRHLTNDIVQEINDPNGATWIRALAAKYYTPNGISGTWVELGDPSYGIQLITNTDPNVVKGGVSGNMIHENVGLGWEIKNWGRISTPAADTQSPVQFATYGTNGASIQFFVGNRTPVGNVTGSPGDLYIRDNTTNSKFYQHRGSGSNNTGWVDISLNQLKVGFYGYRTTGTQSLSDVTETVVAFPNDRDDTGSDFSTSTYRFTAPSAGRYTFSASAQIALTATGYAELRFYSNVHGLLSEGRDYVPSSGTCKPNVSTTINMDASEYIECRAYQSSGASATIQNTGLNFTGAQISKG